MNPESGWSSRMGNNGIARQAAVLAAAGLLLGWFAAGHAESGRVNSTGKSAREISLEEGRKHWAFHPISQPKIPMVRDSEWPRGFVRVVSRATWPQIPSDASGRAQLTDWLASTDNPVRGMSADNRSHDQATLQMHTGAFLSLQPSLGPG